jgi:hypothetical protein
LVPSLVLSTLEGFKLGFLSRLIRMLSPTGPVNTVTVDLTMGSVGLKHAVTPLP